MVLRRRQCGARSRRPRADRTGPCHPLPLRPSRLRDRGPDSAIRNPDLADEWYLPWDNPAERDDRWGGLAPPTRLHLRDLHRLRPVSIRNLPELRYRPPLPGLILPELW